MLPLDCCSLREAVDAGLDSENESAKTTRWLVLLLYFSECLPSLVLAAEVESHQSVTQVSAAGCFKFVPLMPMLINAPVSLALTTAL